MKYELLVYEDAHDDDPVRAGQTESAVDVLEAVAWEAKRLATEEGSEFRFGKAGEDELFEVYPTLGFGTVVVRDLQNL